MRDSLYTVFIEPRLNDIRERDNLKTRLGVTVSFRSASLLGVFGDNRVVMCGVTVMLF